MSFVKELISGIIKKFEIFQTFFQYNKEDIDFKTRINSYEIDDISYLHVLHDYWLKEWNYDSPIETFLERKKRLRVSENGGGRAEMERILRETIEEQDNKSRWDRMTGVA